MKNLISTVFILFIAFYAVNAAQNVVKSPDGAMEVSVNVDNGIPTYSIKYNGKTFLKNSPLGLITNVGDFSSGMALDENVNMRKITETYQLPNIKKSSVNYNATEGIFSFSKNDKAAFDVVFRVSNNDVAFKYRLYQQGQRKSCLVEDEVTGFILPEGTTTFLSAQSKAMVGFARTMPSYEIPYTVDAPTGENGQGNGYTFPCLFKINDAGWILISETGVDSRYCGVRGIKVDFFGGDKQVTMKLYEDILSDANDFGLLVIFHGCTLPRGWERMYPNYAASEAVLASENLHFNQSSCNAEAFNACLHPFIRNTVGSMDFGGSALNKFYNADNKPNHGSKRMTSDVFALATAVMFQSAVQHFALAPNNLTDAPEWAVDFMKKVPVTWDEIRFIDGYPGKYVVLARRHGKNWYIAGINAPKEALSLKVKLPMIEAGKAVKLYSDDEQLNGNLTSVRLDKNQEIDLTIPCNGGALIVSSEN